MKKTIAGLRKDIDQVDAKLVPLLCTREKIVKEIAKIKVRKGIPTRQEEREEEIIKRAKKIAKKNKIDESVIDDVYAKIIFPYGYKIHKDVKRKRNH